MQKQLLYSLIFLLLTSLAGSQKLDDNFYADLQSYRFDFAKSTPKDLIKLLKNTDNSKNKLNPISFMDKAPIDWIKKSDIGFLMTLVNSSDTSKCFISVLSSEACFNNCYSTIGGHAIEMIECYRQKIGYPRSFFNCPKQDKQKAKELYEWRKNNWR